MSRSGHDASRDQMRKHHAARWLSLTDDHSSHRPSHTSVNHGQGSPGVCRQDNADPEDEERRADLDPRDPTAT
ncbi:MAG: hypothetical protein QOH05_764 [Acetobacteraceae bacterium]|nr:hypothetical protein [Acetobacteraceae bacterium]